MKLWLLDADVIIDFLGLDIFDKLIKNHEVYISSTVINEVKYFNKNGVKTEINFRKTYIETKFTKELSAVANELKVVLSKLPVLYKDAIDAGELESLAVLVREKDLKFCSCDAAAIRALPFLDVSERGISVELLLKNSGLLKKGLQDRHTEKYFKNNIGIGRKEKIGVFKGKR